MSPSLNDVIFSNVQKTLGVRVGAVGYAPRYMLEVRGSIPNGVTGIFH